MTTPDDVIAEVGRERLRKSAPNLTDQQWLAWLAGVRVRDGVLRLTVDGIAADYPRSERAT